MDTKSELTVGELTRAAGISRRTLRFYVTRGLLPAPEGRGRGARYTGEHLRLLNEIGRMQDAGLSLSAIASVLAGERREADAMQRVVPVSRGNRSRALPVSTWVRIEACGGIELHLDTSKQNATAAQIHQAQQALAEIFSGRPQEDSE